MIIAPYMYRPSVFLLLLLCGTLIVAKGQQNNSSSSSPKRNAIVVQLTKEQPLIPDFRHRRLFGSYVGKSMLEACAPLVAKASFEQAAKRLERPIDTDFIVLTNDDSVEAEASLHGLLAMRVPETLLLATEERQRRRREPFHELQTLYKAATIGMTQYKWVCFQDLDVLLFAHPLWWMLADPRSQRADLLGCSEIGGGDCPFNAGLFCVRPNAERYAEALELIAHGHVSSEWGWFVPTNLEKFPKIPPPDKSWTFPAFNIDQGLFMYLYGLHHSYHRPHDCTVGVRSTKKH